MLTTSIWCTQEAASGQRKKSSLAFRPTLNRLPEVVLLTCGSSSAAHIHISAHSHASQRRVQSPNTDATISVVWSGTCLRLSLWVKFLNNASRYTNDNLPQELAEIKEIKKANKKLEVMHFDKIEREHYEGQQKFRLDEVSHLQEAVYKKSTLIAKNLKDLNVSLSDIPNPD